MTIFGTRSCLTDEALAVIIVPTPTNVYIRDTTSDTKETRGPSRACVCLCVRERAYVSMCQDKNSTRTHTRSRLLRRNVLPSRDALHKSAQQYKRLLSLSPTPPTYSSADLILLLLLLLLQLLYEMRDSHLMSHGSTYCCSR